MRRYVGQSPDAPFVHPALPSTEHQSIYGVPVPGPTASILVPGVGCVNGCSFCCTSHFFGKKYTPFIQTGKQLFETARSIADTRGTDAFFIMDENFLKDKARAMALIEEMERHRRFFVFHIFSSAEAITAFGIDNLVRLGAQFVWIGFESQSRQSRFVKNKNIVPGELVAELRSNGISVLASGILCMEHHTKENIQEDIDFLVGLEPDMAQFMLLTPLPVTGLYQEHKAKGLLRDDVDWEDCHGQKRLNYKHPAFADHEPEALLKAAFEKDYQVNSSSIYRIIDTNLRGYKALDARDDLDECLTARKQQLKERVLEYGMILPVIAKHPVNAVERQRALDLDREIHNAIRPPRLKDRLLRTAAVTMARIWKWRVALFGDMFQPGTMVTRFRGGDPLHENAPIPLVELKEAIVEKAIRPAAAAAVVEPQEPVLPTTVS
jgi:haloalkane dehalogenase